MYGSDLGEGAGSGAGPLPGADAIRLYVVDDHELVRQGMVDLFCSEEDMAVVGEADGVASAVRGMASCLVDVAVVDLMLADGTGVEICRWIGTHSPQTVCVIITSMDDTTALRATVLARAAGYLPKTMSGPDIVEAVRLAAAGGVLTDPALRATGRAQLREMVAGDARFTDAERHLLGQVIDGRTDREIADGLNMPTASVTSRITVLIDSLEPVRVRPPVPVPASVAG
jgi:two-component system, NarL family, response regulator DevR